MRGVWFEAFELRYRQELQELDDLKIPFKVNEAMKAKGVLSLSLTLTKGNKLGIVAAEGLNLQVDFPDSYPFFRPEVFAKDLSLPRHQNPLGKNLCLLPRPSQYWDPTTTLATYLKAQLPQVLEKGSITDQALIAEDAMEQAEPISAFYVADANFIIASDVPPSGPTLPESSAVLEILEEGFFDYTVQKLFPNFEFKAPTDADNFLRCFINDWKDSTGQVFFSSPIGAKGELKSSGYWYKLSSLNGVNEAFFKSIIERTRPKLKKARQIQISKGNVKGIVGLTFPEEISRGVMGWGWLFIVYGSTLTFQETNRGRLAYDGQFHLKIPLKRIGKPDLQLRIPTVRKLSSTKVAVVGLGSLGAPSAIEFAKNNVAALSLLDCDTVDAGSSVRWPLGLEYIGLYKTAALQHFIQKNFAHTKVNVFNHRIGAPRSFNSDEDENSILTKFLHQTSLVFDASAEEGVSHLMSRIAAEKQIPYVAIEGRRGAWGGLVMRVIPARKKACWMCFQHWIFDGTVQAPPQDESGGIQERGCGDLTFTGTSFDLQNLALAGVRLAAATICNETGYMDMSWNVAVLELVDDKREPIAPRWKTYNLSAHPKCPYCNG